MTSKLMMAGLTAGLTAGLIGAPAAAGSATATAYSFINVENFTVTVDDGAGFRAIAATDIVPQSGGNTSDTFASLNGTTDDDSVSSNFTNPNGLNAEQSFVGNIAKPAEDTFTNIVANNGESFARSDVRSTGVIVGGPIDVTSVADIDVTAVGTGSTQSNVGTDFSFTFTGVNELALDFDAQALASASFGTSLNPFDSSASANTEFVISLLNRSTNVEQSVDLSQFSVSASAFLADGSIELVDTGVINVTDSFTGLNSSDNYRLRIQQISVADVTAVPSPTAAFAGLLGLAGLGMRRRRSSK